MKWLQRTRDKNGHISALRALNQHKGVEASGRSTAPHTSSATVGHHQKNKHERNINRRIR